jgi:hypothetical protein
MLAELRRAIPVAALVGVAAVYGCFSLLGFGPPALALGVAVAAGFVLLTLGLRAAGKPTRPWRAAAVAISCSTLIVLVAIDLLIAAGVIRLGQAHDLAVIPHHRRILTADGYYTGTHEAGYRQTAHTAGQVASYLPDAGFYEPRDITVATDELGLRNPPGAWRAEQDVILLGDSFPFGYGTTQEEIWSQQLSGLNGKRVYNAAVYGSGPTQQIELLRYLLTERGLRTAPGARVALLIFEGNDFTDPNTYQMRATSPVVIWKNRLGQYFEGTLLGKLRQIAVHQTQLRRSGPLYAVQTSERFGPMAFARFYAQAVAEMDRTPETAREVFLRSGIEEGFDRLDDLARDRGLRVSVFYCPTKERVYGRYFPDPLGVPAADHLEALTHQAATAHGYDYVDLTPAFLRAAEQGELVYWRDDTHINARGHHILAELTVALDAQDADRAGTSGTRLAEERP